MLVSAIQTRVKNIFGDTAGVQITDAMIIDWVNDGQLDITRKAECVDGTLTANLVAGDDTYAAPTDIIRPRRATVLGYLLTKTTLENMDVLYPDRASVTLPRGQPLYYWFYDEFIYLYPAPVTTATGGLVMNYVKRPVLVGSSDTPEIPEAYHEDLVKYCLYRAWQQDEEWTQAAKAKQEYDEALLQTIYDAKNDRFDTYPSVTLCPGD